MIKATIGVYETHDIALNALQALRDAHFPLKNISLIGHAEMVDDHVHVKSHSLAGIGSSIGVVAGTALTILSGIGVFLIPGFGFLYGAGAILAVAAGLNFGMIGGGLLALLSWYGVKDQHIAHYEQHLNEGRWMVIAEGEETLVAKAKEILEAHATHIHLDTH